MILKKKEDYECTEEVLRKKLCFLQIVFGLGFENALPLPGQAMCLMW